MNSHGVSVPSLTSSPSPSTMWVCGEIGYAQMTSGRHSATASATAREPSSCLSMGGLSDLLSYARERGGGGGRVALADAAGEALADGGDDRVEPDLACERGEPAEQGGVRQRTAEVLARERRGGHGHQALP